MEDEKLREYVREEFVKSGFISVSQWKNFIDYLQILLKQERKETLKSVGEIIETMPVAFRNKDGSQSPFQEKESGILLTGFKSALKQRLEKLD